MWVMLKEQFCCMTVGDQYGICNECMGPANGTNNEWDQLIQPHGGGPYKTDTRLSPFLCQCATPVVLLPAFQHVAPTVSNE